MDPLTIMGQARQKELQVIGITDHNTTRQARIIRKEFPAGNLMILAGAEVTTREEIHCLAFFDEIVLLDEFQEYLDRHLPAVKTNPDYFGDQVAIDYSGRIVYEEHRLLISALDQSLEQVSEFVSGRGGIFIPAHINRPSFSLLSQLGMIPVNLRADALEWVPGCRGGLSVGISHTGNPYPLVFSSDAHHPDEIGARYTELDVDELSFSGIRKGLSRLLKTEI